MVMINLQISAHEITIIHIPGVKFSTVQGENFQAVLARKVLKIETVFK